MKTLLKIAVLISVVVVVAHSCKKDEDPGPPPSGEGITEEIMASPGDMVHFNGTFTSDVGFKAISLVNPDLMLDKQIVFANKVKKYYLDYRFTVPEETVFGIYEVDIIAEDTDGGKFEYRCKMDVAVMPVAENLTTSFEALPGEQITFTGTITDEQGLSAISLSNAGISLDHVIDLPDHPTEYTLNYTYTIPESAEQIVHSGVITISNVANRSVETGMTVNLTGQAVVYDNIYVAGSFQWWAWNPEFAYPMDQDPDDEKWFEVPLHCWDEYEELKFLAQLAWEPDNWGLVDQNDPSQGMLNANDSDPVLLGAAGGNPAYKSVRFNPYEMQYEVSDLTYTVDPMPEMYLVGKGFPEYPDLDWNPEAAIPMEKNPDGWGEHIFVIYSLEFSDDVDLKFIGQKSWDGYDAGFEVDIQEVTAPVSWIKVKEGGGTPDLKFDDQAGYYTVVFDYYLKRAIIWKEE